jgi:hypothetical protein
MNLLQTRRRTVDQAKMAKNRIRTDGFFDQYSALTGDLGEIFFAPGAKSLATDSKCKLQRVNAVARPSRALSARF